MKTLLFSLFMIASCFMYAQGWEKTYPGLPIHTFSHIANVPDTDEYVLASSYFESFTSDSIFLMKINGKGDVIQQKMIAHKYIIDRIGCGIEELYVLKDGSIVLLLMNSQQTAAKGMVYKNSIEIVKLDSDFNVVWDKIYMTHDSNQELADQLLLDRNGNYIISGYIDFLSSDYQTWLDQKGFLMKLNPESGDSINILIRDQSVGDYFQINDTLFMSVQSTEYSIVSDNLVEIEKKSMPSWFTSDVFPSLVNGTKNQMYITHTRHGVDDLSYGIVWFKPLATVFYNDVAIINHTSEGLTGVAQSYDDGSIIMSTDNFISFDSANPVIYKMVPGQGVVWRKEILTCGGFSSLTDIVATNDNGAIMVGVSNCKEDSYLPYIIRLDSLGNSWSNTVKGKVFIDENKNGVKEAEEKYAANRKVVLIPEYHYQLTDEQGEYAIPSAPNNDLVSLVLPNFLWSQSMPSNNLPYSFSFKDLSDTAFINDFGMYINSYCPLLKVKVCAPAYRRCFDANFSMRYINYGTDTAKNVSIKITLPEGLSYVSCSYPVDSIAGTGRYSIKVGDVLPETGGHINFKTYVSCDSSELWLGDTLCMSFRVNPNSSCNLDSVVEYLPTTNFCSVVQGSYDPNEFFLLEPSLSCIDTTDYLTYQINFQNTGTDTAFNIKVLAHISSLLDMSSIKPSASTHPYTFKYVDKETVEFAFKNILLPDSTIDQAGSHGSVVFSIKQKKGNIMLKPLVNFASIFFDFNSPVITNFDTVTFCQPSLASVSEARENSFSIYPNPAKSELIIKNEKLRMKNDLNTSVSIMNTVGQEVVHSSFLMTNSSLKVDVSQFPAGLYFIRIGNEVHKFVKE